MSENEKILKERKKEIIKLIDELGVESKTDFKRELVNKIINLQPSIIPDNTSESLNQNQKKQLLREKMQTLSSQMEQTQQTINQLKKKHALKKRR